MIMMMAYRYLANEEKKPLNRETVIETMKTFERIRKETDPMNEWIISKVFVFFLKGQIFFE